MNTKTTLILIVIITIAGVGILYFLNKPAQNDSSTKTPVSAITHGHGLAVDLLDSSKVYIATHHGLLVLEGNKLFQVGQNKDDLMGFSAHPTSPNIFFSSGHPARGGNIGFQKSDDGAISWKKLSNGIGGPVDFHAMAVSPVNPDHIYGWYVGKLQKSTDGGLNWKIVNEQITTHQLVSDSMDANTVYAASPTKEGILVTKDGGSTWASLSEDLKPGLVTAIAIHPSDANNMLAFSEKMEGLAQSTDHGKTWKKVPSIFDGTILFLTYSKKDPQIVYALTRLNSLYKSTDSGVSWQKVLISNASYDTAGTPIQSHRSFTIKSDAAIKTFSVTATSTYSFSIVDERGDTLRDFAITHTKPMHVIVVRKDLANFQHLHPDYDASTGTFTLKDLVFPSDGQYRIFADFANAKGMRDPSGNPLAITVSEDVKVGNMSKYKPQSLGAEVKTNSVNGLNVILNTHGSLVNENESILVFNLTQNGKPVTDLQEYLGALGHTVVLREGTLDFIHAHPMEMTQQNGAVSFKVHFPEAGKYKVFTQFQRGDKVMTADFVVSVARATSTDASSSGMEGMVH